MATEWRVTTQRQVDELLDSGSFEPYMEVNFEVYPEGTKGQVKIPLRIYDQETVRSLIDQRVATIKAVQAL